MAGFSAGDLVLITLSFSAAMQGTKNLASITEPRAKTMKSTFNLLSH
jgi:hypothetical protein